MNYWQTLLQTWREEGHDGLTIPFIVGSQKYFEPRSVQDIKQLLSAIAWEGEIDIYLTYCTTINDLILGLWTGDKQRIKGRFLENSRLYLTNGVSDLGVDINTVCKSLEDRYGHDIAASRFSKSERDRGDFSSQDIAFINRCVAKY